MSAEPVQIRRVLAASPHDTTALARLLEDAVEGQASVGFLWPLAPCEALRWAEGVMQSLGPGLMLWLAESDGVAVGTVQLGLCLKPNGRHRGEVMKLLVLRSARGRGIASALMARLEDEARAAGLRLLVLDTEKGSAAEPVYRHLGWQHVGDVPDYALTPAGAPHATAIHCKSIG